ncbi:MAG: hypothetical protein EPO68_08060 [Planctomycetota bacterium]|nr:MAG: hypothetical protein EPO68_08060 [Planctomycetota bacterium]
MLQFALLFASLLSAPAAQQPVAQPSAPLVEASARAFADADSAFAALVPADAFAVLRIESLDALDRAMTALGRVANEPLPMNASLLLAGPLQCPGPVQDIDRRRPLGIALSIPPGGMEPALTFLLPVADAKSYLTRLPRSTRRWAGERMGGYLALSQLDGYSAPAVASTLAAKLPDGVLVARVDAAQLMRSFGPLVDTFVQEFRVQYARQLRSDPLAAKFMGGLPDHFEDFVDAVQSLDVVCALEGERAEISLEIDLDPLSALGKPAAHRDGFDAALAKRLPDHAMVRTLAKVDLSGIAGFYRDMFAALGDDDIQQHMPPDARASFQALTAAIGRIDEIAPLLGRSCGIAYDFTNDGIMGCAFVSSPEPLRLADTYGSVISDLMQLLEQEARGFSVTDPVERSLGGVAFSESRFRVDPSQMGPKGLPPGRAKELQDVFEAMYGKDGTRLSMGVAGDLVVLGANAGDETLLRAAGIAHTSAGADPLLARMSGASSGVWMQLDFARIMGFFARMGTKPLPPEVNDTSLAALGFQVTSWGGVRGSSWFGGLSLDLEALARFVDFVEATEGGPGIKRSTGR